MSHHFSIFAIPCDISCPQLGVGGGRPNPSEGDDQEREVLAISRKELDSAARAGRWPAIRVLPIDRNAQTNPKPVEVEQAVNVDVPRLLRHVGQ